MVRGLKIQEIVQAHPMYAEMAAHGSYVTTIVGRSMLPMLRERRDSVKIVPIGEPLKKRDVALYLRPDETLVLHRVLDVRPEGYTMCGDGQTSPEYGVPHGALLGVMEGYWRDERYIPCTARRYRLYARIWCLSLRVRRVLLWLVGVRGAKK